MSLSLTFIDSHVNFELPYGTFIQYTKESMMSSHELLLFLCSCSPETSILKEIVDTIYNKLDRKEVYLPVHITGMATRYNNEINSWLHECELEFLAIYGMGGSGKTTLAKYIYDSNRNNFEYVSFVEDISNRCNEPYGLLTLQEQLLRDILGGKKRKIPGVSRGTRMIQDALRNKRILIVLDDIDGHSQLVALLGTAEIYFKSKIIITTRENTDNWFEFPKWRCQKYEMRLLNVDESIELLSCHAFGSKIPMAGFEELVLEAVRYCEGNPLALEVLGSSMFKNNTIPNWKSQLSLLGKDIDSRIQDVLVRSYMSLSYNSQKELFLHIACFFIGKDMDYVVKILEPDYSARSGIKALINRCLLSVSPNKKLRMHRLIEEMGKNIIRQESIKFPAKRSRVWLSSDSYNIVRKGTGSETIEGLALDMKMMTKEVIALKSAVLKTDSLKKMDLLKLLHLNFVKLEGSFENFSQDLRWLCWLGFHLTTVPSELYMEHLVAIDMSYSKLQVFEPPTVLQSLRILNLKDSHNLFEIRNIFKIPILETLILWNCYSLGIVCESMRDLTNLSLLNMTGCKKLFSHISPHAASTSGGVFTKQHSFSFPFSLNRLFLKDCNLECTDSFPLSFSDQCYLQYINLGNGLFESLPCYDHLSNLRVLDLSFCSKLKCLLMLPSTLAELYVYDCELLERITFQSSRFTLQEFGYEGCINLYEIEGFLKLVPIAKLEETELGHMKWLKQYQEWEVPLAGDELTVGRSSRIQMLYEFDIMSISLPVIRDPILRPTYVSRWSPLYFVVPSCPENKRLKGINLSFKYKLFDRDWAWFCKIKTANGAVDMMYNPKVFGKPKSGKVCMWLSYWPFGNRLTTGDKVHVSIVDLSGMYVSECGVSLVYSDMETLENNTRWAETLGGDLSGFQLSTGAYYLCRRDFFALMDIDRSTNNYFRSPGTYDLNRVTRLTPYWFRSLVGDTVDYTEIRGWRKTGRPKQVNDPSFTELKTVSCIIHGPQLEGIYYTAEISKSSIVEGEMRSGTISEIVEEFQDMPYTSSQQSASYRRLMSTPRSRRLSVDFLDSSTEYKQFGEKPISGIPADSDDSSTEDEQLGETFRRTVRTRKDSEQK